MASESACGPRAEGKYLTQGAGMDGKEYRSAPRGKAITADFSFPSRYRIRNKSDFQQMQGKGSRLYARHFLLLLRESSQSFPRLGLVVSRKVEKRAVARNTLKRRLREVFRLNHHRFTGAYDLVVIARREAPQCSFDQIEHEISSALSSRGVFLRQ